MRTWLLALILAIFLGSAGAALENSSDVNSSADAGATQQPSAEK